jgi:mRNA-degrading endonuclease toxin of MazEF toxin-antitoxin module
MLPRRATGLEKDSVANVSLVVAVDKALVSERVGRLSRARLAAVIDGIETALGR